MRKVDMPTKAKTGRSWWKRIARATTRVATGALFLTAINPGLPANAQERGLPKVHYFLNAREAPGVVAHSQIARGVPGVGTFQAVSVSGPSGVKVGLARDGQFLPAIDAPVTTAMLVGAVYRFKVTNVPFRPGVELYPTLEIIDKVFTPAGREHRFPIPIVLTEEDLLHASEGALVTRVIYLEDNEVADPLPQTAGEQRTTDVTAEDNALQTADQLGRPVAILRMGSRVPADLSGDLTGFLYGCPPWLPLPVAPTRQRLTDAGQWPAGEDVEPREGTFSERPETDYPRIPTGSPE